jgi:hypothetical protein
MQLDIEDRAYGFEIQRDGAQFALVDRDTFNNWGKLSQRFPTRDAAEEYAYRCDAFKRGRRRKVDLESWELPRA